MRFVSHLLGREEPPQENSWMLLYIRLKGSKSFKYSLVLSHEEDGMVS